ncbi:MAG: hypothetical protein NT007_17640 [Candidatus Kapabacteria bacterium]|nr:hypothetical protein [Candidatus Kapabacteria bacterium]
MKYFTKDKHVIISSILISFAVAVFSLILMQNHNSDSNIFYGDSNSRLVQSALLLEKSSYPQIFKELVWLPLPYLIVIPFCLSETLFHSGFAASIPNIILYLVFVFFISKSNLMILRHRLSALALTLIISLNPNLIYLSFSAMSELSALSALAGFFYFLFKQSDLPKASIFLALATLARYEAWLVCIIFVGLIIIYRIKSSLNNYQAIGIILISISGILMWLIFQKIVNGNWFYFLNAEYYSTSWQSKFSRSGDIATLNLPLTLYLFVKSYWEMFGISVILVIIFPIIKRLKYFKNIGSLHHSKENNNLDNSNTTGISTESNEISFKSEIPSIPVRMNTYIKWLFILLIPVFNFLSIFLGLTEMSVYGLNFRYVALAIISINIIFGLEFSKIKDGKKQQKLLLNLFLITALQYISMIIIPTENLATFKEATSGYFSDRLSYTRECSQYLKQFQSDDILMLTGTGYNHRLIKFSGLGISNFRLVSNQESDISGINNKLIVFNKFGTRDATLFLTIPERLLKISANKYSISFENKYYLILKKNS